MAADLNTLVVARASSDRYRDFNTTRTIQVRHITLGGFEPTVIAGPCAVESRRQTLDLATQVADAGAHMLRGGAYKPRTSPYDFQGLGEKGLEILAEAREKTGLPIVTEVMDPRLVDLVASYADVLQIGTRNMQNAPLLIEAGKSGKPIILKRGFSATLEEWLMAAEYIAAQGNLNIALCERGIRTFANGAYNRNTLDLGIIQPLRSLTYLPIIVDPSHAVGSAELVPWACHASVACGAHGLLVEVIGDETEPSEVLCDGTQGIRPAILTEIMHATRTCRMHALHLMQAGHVKHPREGSPSAMPSCAVLGASSKGSLGSLDASGGRS